MPLTFRTASRPLSHPLPRDALDLTCHPRLAPEGCLFLPFTDSRYPPTVEKERERVRRDAKVRPEAWAAILRRESVLLLCKCPFLPYDKTCVRALVAVVLVELGAEYLGEHLWPELPPREHRPLSEKEWQGAHRAMWKNLADERDRRGRGG